MEFNEKVINNINSNPITSLKISIKESQIECENELRDNGYSYIDMDLRKGSGGNFCLLGYQRKSENSFEPITNIVGTISNSFINNNYLEMEGIRYDLITDFNFNGDVHKGSEGNYLCLYFTRNKNAGKPIKDLCAISLNSQKSSNQEVVQNSIYSNRTGCLDINAGRSTYYSSTPYNYINIYRENN